MEAAGRLVRLERAAALSLVVDNWDASWSERYEVVVQDGLRRMYAEGEEIFYYLSVYNEAYPQPPMPDSEGLTESIISGMYRCSSTGSIPSIPISSTRLPLCALQGKRAMFRH